MSNLHRATLLATAGLLLGLAGYCYLRPDLGKKAVQLETTHAIDKLDLTAERTHTDSVLRGDAPLPRARGRQIVKTERATSDKLQKTSDKQITTLQKQLRSGWLTAFGEMDYAIPSAGPLLDGSLSARIGAQLRLRHGTYVQAFRSVPLAGKGTGSWNVGVRQEVRIF